MSRLYDYLNINIDVDCSLNDRIGQRELTPDQEAIFIAATCERALPRFLDALDASRCRATFFMVASATGNAAFARLIRRIHLSGHEVASHSLTHPKELAHLSAARLHEEIHRSKAILEDVTGSQVYGFRGPGYAHSSRIFDELVGAGYKYSSSTNPAIVYTLVKSFFALTGGGRRRTRGYHPNYRFLVSPREPYYPDPKSFWRRGRQRELLEIPISTDSLRLFPANVWSLMVMLPGFAQSVFWRNVFGERRFANVEFHDLEFYNDDDFVWEGKLPNSTALILNVPFQDRLESIARILRRARARRTCLLLKDVAEMVGSAAEAG